MNSQTREGATMKKKTIVSGIFALILLVSGMIYWKYSNDYTHVIKENWNISIPSDSVILKYIEKILDQVLMEMVFVIMFLLMKTKSLLKRCSHGKKIKEKPSMMVTI